MDVSTTHRTSGMAIASLILSILSFFFTLITLFLGPLLSVPAILCGHKARSECRRESSVKGRGLALAGVVIGYVSLALSIGGIAILLFTHG